MCSDPGQELIKQDIRDGLVNRVVVAACTPRAHEPIFRKACEDAGLNKYFFEMANIQDQCSWAHWHEKKKATEKAKAIVAAAMSLLEPGKMTVEPLISEVNKEKCTGCGVCVPLCPYGAISLVKCEDGKLRSEIDPALCKGCGVCTAACPSKAITLHEFTYEQVLAQIRTIARWPEIQA